MVERGVFTFEASAAHDVPHHRSGARAAVVACVRDRCAAPTDARPCCCLAASPANRLMWPSGLRNFQSKHRRTLAMHTIKSLRVVICDLDLKNITPRESPKIRRRVEKLKCDFSNIYRVITHRRRRGSRGNQI